MELWRGPKVTAFIGSPLTPELAQARLAKEIAQMKEHGVQYWPIFLLENDQHVGCAGFSKFYWGWKRGATEFTEMVYFDHIFELGLHLRPSFWRQGLGKEAPRACIDYGFSTMGAAAFYAGRPRRHLQHPCAAKIESV